MPQDHKEGSPDAFDQVASKYIKQFMAEEQLISGAPLKEIIIKTSSECPFTDIRTTWMNVITPEHDDYCDRQCANGYFDICGASPTPYRIRYLVSECYKSMQYKRMILKNGLRPPELLHTFEHATIDKHNTQLYTYLKQWNPKTGPWVYIIGKPDKDNPGGNGTGKSYVLHALTNRLNMEGVRTLFSRTTDFFNQLKAAYDASSNEREDRILWKYKNVPVLMWDDLGKEAFRTDWGPEKFYHIIDERARNGLKTIISSNFGPDELESRLGDNFGTAIISRIVGNSDMFYLGGPDRRLK